MAVHLWPCRQWAGRRRGSPLTSSGRTDATHEACSHPRGAPPAAPTGHGQSWHGHSAGPTDEQRAKWYRRCLWDFRRMFDARLRDRHRVGRRAAFPPLGGGPSPLFADLAGVGVGRAPWLFHRDEFRPCTAPSEQPLRGRYARHVSHTWLTYAGRGGALWRPAAAHLRAEVTSPVLPTRGK